MIENELLSLIDLHYGIGVVDKISKLEGGYWNQTLKIETGKGNFVLRISPPRTRWESIASQHDLMRFMNNRIPAVPLPVAGKDERTFLVCKDQVISLFPFIKGETVRRGNAVVEISAAQMLAKLHSAGSEYPEKFARPGYKSPADFNWATNSNWDWAEIRNLLENGAEGLKQTLISPIGGKAYDCIDEIAARKLQITEEREKAENWITELSDSARRLVSAPTHGDYYPGNLLQIDDQISAVIDWDECRDQWLAYELGRAAWEFCRDETNGALRPESAAVFIKSYGEAGGLVPEAELNLLIPFICCIRIEEVLFSLGEAVRGEWWDPEYTLYNLLALDVLENQRLFV